MPLLATSNPERKNTELNITEQAQSKGLDSGVWRDVVTQQYININDYISQRITERTQAINKESKLRTQNATKEGHYELIIKPVTIDILNKYLNETFIASLCTDNFYFKEKLSRLIAEIKEISYVRILLDLIFEQCEKYSNKSPEGLQAILKFGNDLLGIFLKLAEEEASFEAQADSMHDVARDDSKNAAEKAISVLCSILLLKDPAARQLYEPVLLPEFRKSAGLFLRDFILKADISSSTYIYACRISAAYMRSTARRAHPGYGSVWPPLMTGPVSHYVKYQRLASPVTLSMLLNIANNTDDFLTALTKRGINSYDEISRVAFFHFKTGINAVHSLWHENASETFLKENKENVLAWLFSDIEHFRDGLLDLVWDIDFYLIAYKVLEEKLKNKKQSSLINIDDATFKIEINKAFKQEIQLYLTKNLINISYIANDTKKSKKQIEQELIKDMLEWLKPYQELLFEEIPELKEASVNTVKLKAMVEDKDKLIYLIYGKNDFKQKFAEKIAAFQELIIATRIRRLLESESFNKVFKELLKFKLPKDKNDRRTQRSLILNAVLNNTTADLPGLTNREFAEALKDFLNEWGSKIQLTLPKNIISKAFSYLFKKSRKNVIGKKIATATVNSIKLPVTLKKLYEMIQGFKLLPNKDLVELIRGFVKDPKLAAAINIELVNSLLYDAKSPFIEGLKDLVFNSKHFSMALQQIFKDSPLSPAQNKKLEKFCSNWQKYALSLYQIKNTEEFKDALKQNKSASKLFLKLVSEYRNYNPLISYLDCKQRYNELSKNDMEAFLDKLEQDVLRIYAKPSSRAIPYLIDKNLKPLAIGDKNTAPTYSQLFAGTLNHLAAYLKFINHKGQEEEYYKSLALYVAGLIKFDDEKIEEEKQEELNNAQTGSISFANLTKEDKAIYLMQAVNDFEKLVIYTSHQKNSLKKQTAIFLALNLFIDINDSSLYTDKLITILKFAQGTNVYLISEEIFLETLVDSALANKKLNSLICLLEHCQPMMRQQDIASIASHIYEKATIENETGERKVAEEYKGLMKIKWFNIEKLSPQHSSKKSSDNNSDTNSSEKTSTPKKKGSSSSLFKDNKFEQDWNGFINVGEEDKQKSIEFEKSMKKSDDKCILYVLVTYFNKTELKINDQIEIALKIIHQHKSSIISDLQSNLTDSGILAKNDNIKQIFESLTISTPRSNITLTT